MAEASPLRRSSRLHMATMSWLRRPAVRSRNSKPPAATVRMMSLSELRFMLRRLASASGTRCGVPTRAVRFLLEIRRGHKGDRQILRVGHDGRHCEPLVSVWFTEAIVVFGDNRARAIGHTILSQITRKKV